MKAYRVLANSEDESKDGWTYKTEKELREEYDSLDYSTKQMIDGLSAFRLLRQTFRMK